MPADAEAVPAVTVPLSQMLILGDSITWMADQPPESFDAIVCDPPYGIEMSNLQQEHLGMDVSSTAAEHDVNSNIALLRTFIPAATRLLKDKSFLVLWCDYSQWNLLQQLCIESNLTPQRWPLSWVKTSPCQNGAAQYNFTKTVEIALVARKGNAVLTSPQSSCYWQGPSDNSLGHPFAKPANLWKWIFNAVSIRGHRVLDPFAGCGSSTVAAVELGLSPIAVECNKAHHDRLVLNVASTYRSMLPNVNFI
jgi:DNA modification methylase